VKKALKIGGALVGVLLLGIIAFVAWNAAAYSRSMSKVYDVPVTEIQVSTDPAVLKRGEHLARSIGSCNGAECHGTDFSGGKPMDMGPLGIMRAPNITPKGKLAEYSNGEIARLVRHGIKKDGTSVLFMPSQDFSWWPDSDIRALISYLRTVPGVDKPSKPSEPGLMMKLLDRQDMMKVDVARRIDHTEKHNAPAPEPTAAYGAFLAHLCKGCHGENLSGGPLPGAPPDLAVPLNITPAEDGLKDWTFEDFDRLMRKGIKKDGSKLDPLMPVANLKHMNDVEMKALWKYLQSVPPKPFGNR
jgi:mono/diheme cytochrome c family protein